MIKSFLMIGQSNMAGRGFLDDVEPIYNERIKMLRNGRWQMMAEPINYDRPVAGVGLAGSFAAAWCLENRTDEIGLIPCAEGGSTLAEWAVDGILFRNAVSQVKLAMENSELAGIMWHQGESDSYGESYKTYYKKFLIILDTLRKELNVPDIPVIIGGLGDYLGQSGFGKGCTEYKLINNELEKIAFKQPNCYYVTGQNLTCNPDGIHIDAISQRKFGYRYFESFSKKKHIMDVLTDEEKFINPDINRVYTKNEKIYLESMEFALGKISYDTFEARMIAVNEEGE
ncbi:sialate O-acetylesterase [Enterococcus sp. BWB1-3]|uniref:sialate O-acetylesterase n=1 Tax=Enterococcus sp. BWB1-3 TaxID=2787713 RepID=UPI001921B709|nr:sialate O-acetylesterase [Enterococcus sp. BWB1-3]MBL1230602.1 sialate O-acetylesterase [Enterococcus sp. BWB1-3]